MSFLATPIALSFTVCRFIRVSSVVVCTALLFTPLAQAQETKCSEAKPLVKAVNAMQAFPDTLTDSLQLALKIYVRHADGSPVTQRMFYRAPEGRELDFDMTPSGQMDALSVLIGQDARGELCRVVPNTASSVTSDDESESKVTLSVETVFTFTSRSGEHSVSEIEDGLRDGTKQMKSLAPAAVRLLVPRLKYIAAQPEDAAAAQVVMSVMKDGTVLEGLVRFDGQVPVVPLAALKRAKADKVVISGGAYRLLGVPKIEKQALSDASRSPEASQSE